ncbi:MAG: hypothetical protein ACHRHE_02715, partial [Tepidisphaerales bacterium]
MNVIGSFNLYVFLLASRRAIPYSSFSEAVALPQENGPGWGSVLAQINADCKTSFGLTPQFAKSAANSWMDRHFQIRRCARALRARKISNYFSAHLSSAKPTFALRSAARP